MFSHSAYALTVFDVGDARDFGSVKFCGSDRLTYVNHLASMALNTTEKYNGQTYVAIKQRVWLVASGGVGWSCRRYR